MNREKCPTCGSPVVVASSGEGTSYYVHRAAELQRIVCKVPQEQLGRIMQAIKAEDSEDE